MTAKASGYRRSYSGFIYAARRMGLCGRKTAEKPSRFFKMLQKVFPFPIRTIQTDNGTEFTCKYISETEKMPV